MNIIGHKNIFLTSSGVVVLAALVLILIFGFRQAVDFTGGTLWQFRLMANNQESMTSELKDFFQSKLEVLNVSINFEPSNGSFLVRMPLLSEEKHRNYLELLKSQYPDFEELSFQSIGPSIGQELRRRAFWAIGLVLLAISLYIAFAFRKVSQPVQSWKYGLVTLVTLFHDVIIPAGLLAALGAIKGIEIDTAFVVALLVIAGFSVHDTIVVFDRIRENLILDRGRSEFGEVANRSVNQTLARSINTSLTLILVLMALYFVGPVSLRYFVLTLIVGIGAGTYSSIFVASPLVVLWRGLSRKN